MLDGFWAWLVDWCLEALSTHFLSRASLSLFFGHSLKQPPLLLSLCAFFAIFSHVRFFGGLADIHTHLFTGQVWLGECVWVRQLGSGGAEVNAGLLVC